MRGPQAMMRTPLMIESPSRPGTDQRDLARRRLAAAELWPSVNRRPSIHSADTQVQTGPACEWSGATGRDSVVSSPLRDVHVNRGVLAVRARNGDEQLQARLALVAEPRAVSCFMAEWIESVLSGFES